MDAGFFWGLFLVLAGVVLLARIVFNIDFPLFKVLVGLFFILIGIRILFGKSFMETLGSKENEVIFSDQSLHLTDISKKEYNVIFGKSDVDLTDLNRENLPARMKINTVFGSTTLYVPEDLPLIIYSDAVFSNAKLPGGNSSVFGRTSYKSPGIEKDTPYLEIKFDVVFGSVAVLVR
jgi:predicted membrane protein